ncbi:MAG: hypothetical protein AAFW46_04045 [Pseudomonadota bacterium]
MGSVLILVAVGAGIGYAAWAYGRLEVSALTAVSAGALGALVFGTLIKLLAGLVISLFVAVIGAIAMLALAQAYERRRRR